jgi:hypothetical protein
MPAVIFKQDNTFCVGRVKRSGKDFELIEEPYTGSANDLYRFIHDVLAEDEKEEKELKNK